LLLSYYVTLMYAPPVNNLSVYNPADFNTEIVKVNSDSIVQTLETQAAAYVQLSLEIDSLYSVNNNFTFPISGGITTNQESSFPTQLVDAGTYLITVYMTASGGTGFTQSYFGFGTQYNTCITPEFTGTFFISSDVPFIPTLVYSFNASGTWSCGINPPFTNNGSQISVVKVK